MLTIPTFWPYFLLLFGVQWLIAAIRERNNAKLLGTPFAFFDAEISQKGCTSG